MVGKVSQRPDRTRRFTPFETPKKKREKEIERRNHLAKQNAKERNSEEQRQMQRPACPTTPSHFAPPNFGRFQGKSASVYTHTHTARQHNREADKAPDTKTKAAGFYTRRSRDGEMNKEWLPDEAKETGLGLDQSRGTPTLFLPFPSRKEQGSKEEDG